MKVRNTDMYHFLSPRALATLFTIFSGEDSVFPLYVATGARRHVVTASLLPRLWKRIFDLARDGQTGTPLQSTAR